MTFGSKEVLKGVNLEVPRGQIIGYIGTNGAGKSTTIKIILGLIEGFKGKVEVFGEDISNGDTSYKQRIGYVPETADIYDHLTAIEYLTFIGELYGMAYDVAREKSEKLLETFDMTSVLHGRISSYSKGMRQKVLIISSLLHDPDLLFLDEPLSGLDASSVMVVREILEELAAQGKTIFYSSHIMEVVERISHRIVLLADGKVMADGTFEELKASSHQGSLDQIFNQLTGFGEHEKLAKDFVHIISGVSTDE